MIIASCSHNNLNSIKKKIVGYDHEVKTECYMDGLELIDRVNTVIK